MQDTTKQSNHLRSAMRYLIVGVVLVVAPATFAGAGWQDEVAVTADPVLQFRSYLAIGPDDTAYVLWPDWTDFEDTQVTLSKSTDQGQTWSNPAVLFDGTAYDNFAMVADAGGLHVLLVEFLENQEESKFLYYSKSTDGGATFSNPEPIGDGEHIEDIRLFAGDGKLYIYAKDFDFDTEEEINHLYVSEDNGDTWSQRALLPSNIVTHPDFAVDGGVIHVVFGGGLFGDPNTLYAYTDNDGESWSSAVPVSAGAGAHSQLPQIVVDGSTLVCAWEDDRSGRYNVMYSTSVDGGATWDSDTQLNDTSYGARVQLLADERGLHAVWCQYHGDDGWPTTWSSADYGIVWYRFSDDGGQTWTPEFRVSQNEDIPPINLPSMGANHVKIAPYGTGFATLWQDKRDGNYDLYFRSNLEGPGDDASIIDAKSLLIHAQDPQLELAVDLDESDGVEPRILTGSMTLVFEMDKAIDEATVLPGNVQIACAVQTPPPVAGVSLADDSVVTVEFIQPFADVDCCTFMFDGMATLAGGVVLDAYPFVPLRGDMNFSGAVTGGDALLVKTHFGEIAGVDLAHPKWDFDRSGVVTGGDYALIKPRFGNVAPACP